MSITNKLNQIKNAIYGKDVRGAIHDAIKQVYDDASVNHDNANMEVKMARGTHNTLNDRLDNVDEIQTQTNAQLSDKVHKGEAGVISNAMLSQEVKEAMTGGSVAVVGKDAVLTENIADGQVTGEKTDFLDVRRLNLFDGKFLNGYVSGNPNSAKYTTTQVGKTIALNIESNTDYSVIKTHTEAESGHFFLKVVTSTKTVEEVIGTMVSGYSAVLDGEVQLLETSATTPLLKRNFTSGANDKSVFITVARELTPYVEVLKGTYSDFQHMTYDPLYIPKKHVDVYRKKEVQTLLQNLVDNGEVKSLANNCVQSQHIVDGEVARYKLHDYERKTKDYEAIPMNEIEVRDNCYYATGSGALIEHENYLVWNFKATNEDAFIRLDNIFRAHILDGNGDLTFVSLVGGSDNAGLQEFILPKGMTLGVTLEKANTHFASLEYAPNYTLKGLTIDSTKVHGKFSIDDVDFINSQRPSLFHGDFVDFYLAGKPEQDYTLRQMSGYKTLILNVEPNTKYTVLKEPTDAENGYYYFKLATATLDRKSLLKCNSYVIDGSVAYSKTELDTTKYSFTTGENDKSVIIVVAKSLSPYVEVHEGEVDSFISNSYEPISNLVGLNVYNKNEVDAIVRKLNQKTTPSNTFVKTSNRCEILLQDKVGYVFERKVISGINLDTWMLTKGTIHDITLWSGSDIEAPIKEVGTDDFIGGVHGDERFESVQIICDGVLLDLDSDYNLNFNNLTVFVKSTLFRCDTDVPVFTRYKKLEFIDNELIISNRLICLVDNFLVNRHTGCGLYSVYKDLLVGYTVNTKPELITSGATNNDAKLDCGSFYGNGFTVTLKTLSGKTDYYKGSVVDFANESRPRYKLYFDCINSSSGVRLSTNDELNTSFSINIA